MYQRFFCQYQKNFFLMRTWVVKTRAKFFNYSFIENISENFNILIITKNLIWPDNIIRTLIIKIIRVLTKSHFFNKSYLWTLFFLSQKLNCNCKTWSVSFVFAVNNYFGIVESLPPIRNYTAIKRWFIGRWGYEQKPTIKSR